MLDKILAAREQRMKIRKSFASNNLATISLTLNIPGYPKTSPKISQFFNSILHEVKIRLEANRITLNGENQQTQIDEAGNFFIAAIQSKKSLKDIKNICEDFEQKHEAGRLIDLDITDLECKPVSSGKAKNCFICTDIPAVTCMRNNTHTMEELRFFIDLQIDKYLYNQQKTNICTKLSEYAVSSILQEISLYPKPGLVDPVSNGSHTDMDYSTFLHSTASLSPFFYKFAQKALLFIDLNESALIEIRSIGLEMETSMFKATNGINTQKGIIFLMGIAIFVSAKIIIQNGYWSSEKFIEGVKNLAKNILNEFDTENPVTHGEKCYAKYGKIAGGARYQAWSGFETVFKEAAQWLQTKDKLTKPVLIRTLLILMTENDDTNILYRTNSDTLNELKQLARKCIEDAEFYNETNYTELINYCLKKRISPGGSADLLAITIFINFVEKNFHKL